MIETGDFTFDNRLVSAQETEEDTGLELPCLNISGRIK